MRKATLLGAVLALGIGTAVISPAHAEWHNGQWGHWGWHKGVWVFVAEPYPYGYYPYGYAPPPPPPPVYYAPPPPPPVVVGPSFGISIGIH
jgi:hypothetical protein